MILENGVWIVSEKSAPVKGKKVSLKIQKADLIDRKTVFQVGSFFVLWLQYFFLFPLTFSDFPDGSGGEKGERKDRKGFDENEDNISSIQDDTISF